MLPKVIKTRLNVLQTVTTILTIQIPDKWTTESSKSESYLENEIALNFILTTKAKQEQYLAKFNSI